MKLSKIKELVSKCLAEDVSTRNSDWKLYVRVCQSLGLDVNSVTLSDIYEHTSIYPTFESVSRARRKFQADGLYEAEESVRNQRAGNTKEYIKEFA